MNRTPREPRAPREPREHAWQVHERRREEEALRRVQFEEQLLASVGGLLSFLKNPPVDDVLVTREVVIDASGVYVESFPIAFAALAVANLGTVGPLTVASDNGDSAAPTQGVGIFQVPQSIFRVVGIRGRQLAIYGAQGGVFDLTVYARPVPPFSGLVIT